MKRIYLIIITLSLAWLANAQTVFYDASLFPLLGKISDATETRYERLPARLNGVSRKPVWDLGKNTAGLAVRFCSDARQISVRWETLNNAQMNHMAFTGIKGLDLYSLENGVWTYVNTARPTEKKTEAVIISNMEKKERELMLYLPLYDGVVSLEIGVDSLAYIGRPKIELPLRTKPIVAYGTSILQGGCASRTGMAHTNILSRRLNREVINLGFSGSAQLDYDIAELIAECDASIYLLDFTPNVNVEQINEKAEKFYRILRDKRPETPIVFIENPVYPHSAFNVNTQNAIRDKNKALRTFFDGLKAKKEKNIWLIPSAGMIGTDGEATVDGVHFTDLGFLRYADFLVPKIRKILAAVKPVSSDNQLTQNERKEGWRLLFDGKTMNGWRRIYTNDFPKAGWHVENGCLVVENARGRESSNGGDLVTVREYGDFDFTFDFKMTPGANSGIKYFVNEAIGDPSSGYGYGPEYQVIDDKRVSDLPVGGKLAGLYELIEAPDTKKVNVMGEWNTGRIVSKNNRVEHWLNGQLLFTYVLGSDEFKALVQKSKFKDKEGYAAQAKGFILIQDHGSMVSYKNLKIKEL